MPGDTAEVQIVDELVVPQDGETPPSETQIEAPADDPVEVVVTIGEAPPPADEEEPAAPAWVKELRKSHRELARENRELKQKLVAPVEVKPAESIPKPTLDDCKYDEDLFEQKLTAWHEQQAKVKADQQKKLDAEKAESDAWAAKVLAHNKAKTELKVADYEDAEESAKTALSVTQQSIIVSGSDNSAVVVYALGKNPAKLKELAAITDPVKFAFAVAKLETQLKVTPRKAPPPPETTVRSNAPVVPGSSDKELDRLRAEATKTGDMTKVMQYRKQLKAKAA